MNRFKKQIFPQLCTPEESPFRSKSCRLVSSVLWHNRFLTTVYRFTVEDNSVYTTYYLKSYSTEQGKKMAFDEYSILKRLTVCFGGEKNLRVIKPVLYIPSLKSFVTEEFTGTNLYKFFKDCTLITASRSDLDNAMVAIHKLCQWIKVFQKEIAKVEIKSLNHVLKSDIEKDLNVNAETRMLSSKLISLLRIFIKKDQEVLSYKSYTPVACNQDAKLWNFLLSNKSELCALDFVGYSYGPAVYDIARLWVGLNWIKIFPLNSENKVNSLQEIFLSEFNNYELFDKELFRFFRLAVTIEAAAFYSNIRKDRYRRKFRNIVFFPLIVRYYNNLLMYLVEKR